MTMVQHMSPTVNITRQLVGEALYKQRRDVAGDARRTTAINRAALNLEACPWQFNQDEAELVIISASDPERRYHVGPLGCDCQAARASRPCWHAAAYQIIMRAVAIGNERQNAARPKRSYVELTAAANAALFGD